MFHGGSDTNCAMLTLRSEPDICYLTAEVCDFPILSSEKLG